MINGLEGIPGSGKSYEASVVHVLEALKRGRKVITNLPLNVDAYATLDPGYRDLIELRTEPQPIRGTWDAERAIKFQLWPNGETKPQPKGARLWASVWDFWTDWKHKDGFGPLFVIDECQVPMAKGKQLEDVVDWFKYHRHYNVDVLLCTQNFRDVNASISSLLAMLIKVRKADIIGKSGYIRKVHGGYRGGVVSTETREYDRGKFILYQSHTQGGAVEEFKATDVSSVALKMRRAARVFGAVAVLGFIALGFSYFTKEEKPPRKVLARSPKAAAEGQGGAPAPVPVVQRETSKPVENHEPEAPEDLEPYAAFGLHLTGSMQMRDRSVWTFTVSQNGLVTHSVTDAQLVKAGYTWRPLAECAGILEFAAKRRAITCNTPQVQMVASSSKSS